MNGGNYSRTGDAPAISASFVDEMTAFDRLGPATRAALAGDPIKISALHTWRQIDLTHLNPKDPQVDARIAAQIEQGARAILEADTDARARAACCPPLHGNLGRRPHRRAHNGMVSP